MAPNMIYPEVVLFLVSSIGIELDNMPRDNVNVNHWKFLFYMSMQDFIRIEKYILSSNGICLCVKCNTFML